VKLYTILKTELVKRDCFSSNKEELLEEMVHHLKLRDKISNDKLIIKKLIEREKLGSTSIGNSSAVPHTKLKELKEPVIFIAISKKGVPYNESDKKLVHFIILILSPVDSPIIHLQILAAAASLIKKSNKLIKELVSSETDEKVVDIIKKYEVLDD
jgi:mannitol/fructose-specific phosphotransferase system IIA component (Ntr-type)